MNYKVYFNDRLVDLEEGQDLAQTLQVNDLASLDTRQTNYSSKLKAKRTAHNEITFKHLGMVGSKSDVPYIRNKVMVFEEGGECRIFSGWGVVNGTFPDHYDITIYDGIIDFYKRIENKSLTEIGISDLNHIKNMATVVESFNDELPYIYIVADYNGKTYFDGGLNIDYLVPSARISYLWNRIHEFSGFTFEGSTFSTEKFINKLMTYPKPVPILAPIVDAQTSQVSEIIDYPTNYVTETGGLFYGSVYSAKLLPTIYTAAASTNASGYISILQTGAFRIQCSGSFENSFGEDGLINWSLRTAANVVIEEGVIDAMIQQSVVISASEGDRIYLTAQRQGFNQPNSYNPLSGSVSTTIDLIVGYDANFEEVLVEFSAKDFVNQIMVDFGLTAFKDRYKDHIVYKTLDEILQNQIVQNWSSRYDSKISEKYRLGNYGQRNLFKYKYNSENEDHKDGFITINDVNIKDEVTVISSKIYAPEKRKNEIFLGLDSKVYKIWNKEVKDNGDVNYKDLSGRYYFLRADFKNRSLLLTSENLNTTATVARFPLESDFRLHYQQIIIDNYLSIGSILDQSKVVEAIFKLTVTDIQNFKFDELIFVDQLQSYFLVNKIMHFRKGRKTKLELINVDYLKELEIPEPEAELTIDSISIAECLITINCVTNIPQPFQVEVVPYQYAAGSVGDFYWQPVVMDPINATLNDDKVEILSDFLPFSIFGYRFLIRYVDDIFNTVTSQLSEMIMVDAACYDVPDVPTSCDPSGVEITNIARSNAAFPTIYDAGSLWSIQYTLVGVDDPSSLCVPYQIRVEINSNLGLQIYNSGNVFSIVGSLVFNMALRPTSASVRIFFINPDLVEFPSQSINY